MSDSRFCLWPGRACNWVQLRWRRLLFWSAGACAALTIAVLSWQPPYRFELKLSAGECLTMTVTGYVMAVLLVSGLLSLYFFRRHVDVMKWGLINGALPLTIILTPALIVALVSASGDTCEFRHWQDKVLFKSYFNLWELVVITAAVVWWDIDRHFGHGGRRLEGPWQLVPAYCILILVVGTLLYALPLPIDYFNKDLLGPIKTPMFLFALIVAAVFPLGAMYVLAKLPRNNNYEIYP